MEGGYGAPTVLNFPVHMHRFSDTRGVHLILKCLARFPNLVCVCLDVRSGSLLDGSNGMQSFFEGAQLPLRVTQRECIVGELADPAPSSQMIRS